MAHRESGCGRCGEGRGGERRIGAGGGEGVSCECLPGLHHTVTGVLRGVKCSAPNVLRVTVDQAGKKISLYANDYYKIVFTTANYKANRGASSVYGY